MLDKTNEIHLKRYYVQLDVFSTLTQVFTKKKKNTMGTKIKHPLCCAH